MLDWIAKTLGARAVRRTERIQSLWGGYGELFRIEVDDGRTAVVKWAHPPAGAAVDASFVRKCRSFDIETAFYRDIAPRCDETCRVPTMVAARAVDREWILVLEDLDAAGFGVRIDEAGDRALDTALAWLASFHARFVGERADTLWPVGTYWHLATRHDELATIDDLALREAALRIAQRLVDARFQTLLHGDAKDANFCFTRDHAHAAGVDFQYTGRGAGIVDLAYLLYGRTDEPNDGIDHVRVEQYFAHLRRALALRAVDIDALEAEWRALYPIARLDFCRFLAGWRPASWRHDARGRRFVHAMLRSL